MKPEPVTTPRRGRPRTRAIGERRNVTVQIDGKLHEALSDSARQKGKSISSEIESRLERSFWELDIGAIITKAVQEARRTPPLTEAGGVEEAP